MKKLLALLLAAVMTVSVVACGSKGNDAQTDAPEITDALEILTTVWGSYEEADLFPVGGGDSANLNFEGPAKFDVAAVEELDVTLGLPADLAGQIDDAASMMNAMMANNFTAGVYHLTDASTAEDFTATLKDALLAKQWMCGMPEKVVIITVGDYVVSVFGLAETLDTFTEYLTAAYPSATVVCEEGLM